MVTLFSRCFPALVAVAAGLAGAGSPVQAAPAEKDRIEVATNLSIEEKAAGAFEVTIADPVHPEQTNHYRLLSRENLADDESLPAKEGGPPEIVVPVEKIVSLSTTYAGAFAALGAVDHLIAVDNAKYLFAPALRERAANGDILEVGAAGRLDLEVIIALQPQLVLLTQINPGQENLVSRLEAAGIPVLVTAAWRENSPLGRSEWIKLFGILCGEEERAETLFSKVRERYESLRNRVAESDPAPPQVLLSAPYGGTWYMPGGDSFSVQLLKDAGAQSLWPANPSTGSFPIDIESAMLRGFKADFWLNPGQYASLAELAAADPRFADLPVFAADRVYNRNAQVSPNGANDYWESGSVYPDRILADLISIFHPELLPDHELFYYRKLP